MFIAKQNQSVISKFLFVSLSFLLTTGYAFSLEVNEPLSPKIFSNTYPDSKVWYSSKEARFSWNLTKDVTAVKILYDNEPNSKPTKLYEPAISEKEFQVDKDGVYYLHLQFKTSSAGWGEIVHYKFQIDSAKPEYVKLSMPDGLETYDVSPTFVVEANDTLSGIDHAVIQIDNNPTETIEAENLLDYKILPQSPGIKTAIVTVFDKAGNSLTQSLNFEIAAIRTPLITDYTKKTEEGDDLKITGITYPNSTVEIVFVDINGVKVFDTVRSDSAGNFTMLWTGKLDSGAYEMKARVVDFHNTASNYTDTKIVSVERKTYIQFGLFIVNWLTVVLLSLIAVVSVSLTLWYLFLQFNRWKRKIHRTIRDVEVTLKANVQALRRDTEEFHTLLAKAEKKRELTKEENAIFRKFKKRLEVTEKEIEQKLERIG